MAGVAKPPGRTLSLRGADAQLRLLLHRAGREQPPPGCDWRATSSAKGPVLGLGWVLSLWEAFGARKEAGGVGRPQGDLGDREHHLCGNALVLCHHQLWWSLNPSYGCLKNETERLQARLPTAGTTPRRAGRSQSRFCSGSEGAFRLLLLTPASPCSPPA